VPGTLATRGILGNRRCIITRRLVLKLLVFSRQITFVALSKKDIDYIAHLAHLEISADETPMYMDKLGRIVEFIDELGSAQTDGLLPMAHPLEMSQRLRADEVKATNERDRYQQNSAVTAQGLYLVPRVIE
jgi:aspartyl-tRNA(Asn)/glutamyl-tRNA(Gln) amidotransferase subunit C